MKDQAKIIQQWFDKDYADSMTYDEYISLIASLHEKGETTGDIQNDVMLNYGKLNQSRMKRILKTQKLNESLVAKLQGLKKEYTWLIITEAWCGDAAQSLPIIERLSRETEHVTSRYVLRDANMELMNQFLTDGGKAIPVVICIDTTGKLIWTWGPRPAEIQQKVRDYKAAPEPKQSYADFAEDNQRWYMADKGLTVQEEVGRLVELMD